MSRSDAGFHGVIPAHVRYDKAVTPMAKVLYAELTALMRRDGYAWAKNEYFAEAFAVSTPAICQWLDSLVEAGHITLCYRGKERRIYPTEVYLMKERAGRLDGFVAGKKPGRPIKDSLIQIKPGLIDFKDSLISSPINTSLNEDVLVFDSASAFAVFWKAYPNKIGKAKAGQIFQRLIKTALLRDQLMAVLEVDMKSRQWLKDSGQFVPHPTTWLNRQRWLDFESIESQDGATAAPARDEVIGTYMDYRIGKTVRVTRGMLEANPNILADFEDVPKEKRMTRGLK